MMRLDYVRQQRQWQAEQARAAPIFDYEPEEEEEDYGEEGEALFGNGGSTQNSSDMEMQLPQSSFGAFVREDEIDQVLQMEDEELEALLEHLPMQQYQQTQQQDDGMKAQSQWSAEHFGSDDEDYDVIFSEMLSQSSVADGAGTWSTAGGSFSRDADEMDES
jgi:hypothetical protein